MLEDYEPCSESHQSINRKVIDRDSLSNITKNSFFKNRISVHVTGDQGTENHSVIISLNPNFKV
jgi:hypothetical protein